MERMDHRKGSCLCGAVRIEANLPRPEFQACHCNQCQTWTGGGPLLAIRAQDIAIQGTENVRTYHASDWGERASCKVCGSILWWTLKGKPPAFIALGLLEDRTGLALAEEIFVDHRPAWFPAIKGASQSSEAEQQAQLMAYLEKKR